MKTISKHIGNALKEEPDDSTVAKFRQFKSKRIVRYKRKCGIIERENFNLPKSEDSRQPDCTKEKKDAKGKTLCMVLQVICSAVIGITITGRMISGVHWFTDIIGGILTSISLLALYSGILERIDGPGAAS